MRLKLFGFLSLALAGGLFFFGCSTRQLATGPAAPAGPLDAFTATPTPSFTLTVTAAFTATKTPTLTPTGTPVFTLATTPTFTATITPTSTAATSPAFTVSSTPTSNLTVTPNATMTITWIVMSPFPTPVPTATFACASYAPWNHIQPNSPSPNLAFAFCVVFNNQIWYMADGGSQIWSSPDGVNWTLQTSNSPFTNRVGYSLVVYNGLMWVIAGYNCHTIGLYNDVWNSSDGVNWNLVTANAAFSPREYQTCAVYGGKLWLMSAFGNTTNDHKEIWSTSDGANWTLVSDNFPTYPGGLSVFQNKMWVLGDGTFFNSTDGITWNQLPVGNPNPLWFTIDAASVVYNDQFWLVTGWGSNPSGPGATDLPYVWHTSDGTHWTLQTCDAGFSRYGPAVVFNGKIWVITGEDIAAGTYPGDIWNYP